MDVVTSRSPDAGKVRRGVIDERCVGLPVVGADRGHLGRSMRVLVTGGAGYVGSTLVPMLLHRGHAVRVLDTFRFGDVGLRRWLPHPGLEVVRGDVRDPEQVRDALRGATAVVHLAAVVGYPACAAEPRLAQSTNVDGTATLLAARHRDQPVVFASTGGVYGHVPHGVCDEDTAVAPLTLYGRTKAAGERLAAQAGNTTILRFATAFGAGPITRLDLLPNDFTLRALRDRQLTVFQPAARRTFLHVHDIARAILFALDHQPRLRDEVLNVGDPALNLTKAGVAALVARHVEVEVDLDGHGHDPDERDYDLRYDRLRGLGFHATVDADSGIRHLVRALASSGGSPIRAGHRLDLPDIDLAVPSPPAAGHQESATPV